MKKAFAIIGIVVGGLAVVCCLSVILLIIFVYPFGLVIDIVIVGGIAFLIDLLRLKYRKVFGINAAIFLAYAYAPSVVASAASFIAVAYLDSIGYFKGIFAGLGEFVFSLSAMLTAGAMLAAALICLFVRYLVGRAAAR